jgi:hypothetical protein
VIGWEAPIEDLIAANGFLYWLAYDGSTPGNWLQRIAERGGLIEDLTATQSLWSGAAFNTRAVCRLLAVGACPRGEVDARWRDLTARFAAREVLME